MKTKKWIKSKRLWTGVIALITGLSLILTGEKTLEEQLPTLILTGIGLAQFIVALVSGKPVEFGGKTFYKDKHPHGIN